MSTAAQANARPVPRRRGLIVLTIEVIVGLVFSVAISLITGTVIEWVGMHSWWKDEGVHHSRNVVIEDLGYLQEFPRSLITDDTVNFAREWSDAATSLADRLGLVSMVKLAVAPIPDNLTPTQTRARKLLAWAGPYLLAAIFVWQDAFIRLAIVVLALPAFFLATTVGLVDGLARRDVRRWSAGRETSFVYHNAKRLLWPAFTGGFFLYLTWPTGGFNPAWMVLPFCAAAAVTISLMAATFKKYL